jgi:hypothetical protein
MSDTELVVVGTFLNQIEAVCGFWSEPKMPSKPSRF